MTEDSRNMPALADRLSDLVLESTAEGAILLASPSSEPFLGYRPGALTGVRLSSLMHRDDLPRLANELTEAAAMRGDRPAYSATFRLRRADGPWVWVESRRNLQFTPGGQLASVIDVMHDITAHRNADEQLREDSERLKFVLENASDLIVRILPGHGVTWVSPNCRKYGREPKELLGQGWVKLLHPDDADRIMRQQQERFAGVPTPDEEQRRFRFLDGAGNWIWMEGNPTLIRDPEGRPIELVMFFRDVTQRVHYKQALAESEARYRLLADNVSDVIAAITPDARFTYLSPSVENLLGYKPEELLGKPTRTVMHEGDYLECLKAYGAHLTTDCGAEPLMFEFRAYRKDGAEIWIAAHPRPVFDTASGEVVGFQDVLRDITVRKALEEELRQRTLEAETAATVKAEFLANMSHEIRTPLTAILGYTERLLTKGGLTDEARTYAERVSTAGDALLSIVNDVLDFSKLEAGQVRLAAHPTDLASLLGETLRMFAPQAERKGVDLILSGVETLPASCLVDSDRLRQVLINLIGNAVKFTHKGFVRLEAFHDSAAQQLHVRVKDSGPGLDEEQQALLFQRFSQVDGSTARRHGGTGLGLAICKALVEAMGGRIGISSRPGAGAVFYFEVDAPLSDDTDAAQPDAALPIGLAGLRLLVVDDHATNRELAKAVLTSFGAVVHEAAGGQAALDLLAGAAYDAVLLDIRMPEMDGIEVLNQLRRTDGPNQAAPVLAFSADIANSESIAGLTFSGSVFKPIRPDALAIEVARVARRELA